jgi:hypothetical protein
MKKLLIVLIILLLPLIAFAADVSLRWESVPGATGYKIYMSIDNCATWLAPKDVGNVLIYVYAGVPDDKLVHFKGSAYRPGLETMTNHMGAFWDSRQIPLGNPLWLSVK